MSVNKNVTSFRWELVDLCKQRSGAGSNHLTSNLFSLSTRSSVQFALFIEELWFSNKNTVRVILKQADGKPIEASIKLWIESTLGQRFGETFVEKHVFSKVGDECRSNKFARKEYSDFCDLYTKHETFFFCCEITDLNGRIALSIDHDQKFLQDQWQNVTYRKKKPNRNPLKLFEEEYHLNRAKLFEEEYHDAVITVEGKEFKVMKGFFMCQSEVFKSMFLSKFKEGVTSKIEIKNIDASKMQHLISWMYTGQLEDKAPLEHLFQVADKYDIKVLKKICTENMLDSFSATNAFQRLILASIHSHNELKDAALNVIAGLPSIAFSDFLVSDNWTDFAEKNKEIAKEVRKLIHNKMHE